MPKPTRTYWANVRSVTSDCRKIEALADQLSGTVTCSPVQVGRSCTNFEWMIEVNTGRAIRTLDFARAQELIALWAGKARALKSHTALSAPTAQAAAS